MFSQQPSLPCAPRRTWRRQKKSPFPSVHAYSARGLPPCQLACVAIIWLLTMLHFTAGPSYTHARSTMVTSQLAEFALQSRHPRAVASASSLRIRAQTCSHTRLPRADVGVEHWAVTDCGSNRCVCSRSWSFREGFSVQHGSLFYSELPETVR